MFHRSLTVASAMIILIGSFVYSTSPAMAAGVLEQIDRSESYSCGLDSDGFAYCWGLNDFGQLGDGTTTNANQPVPVDTSVTFTSISTEYRTTCAVAVDSSVYCWGSNSYGQIGDGSTTQRLTPTMVDSAVSFASVTIAGSHACGLSLSGAAYCWGANWSGQLGDNTGDYEDSSVPVPVVGGHTFVDIGAGIEHSCGTTNTNSIRCWGNGSEGELGDGSNGERLTPTLVVGGHSFLSVSVNLSYTCGLTTDGDAYCWGENLGGVLGDGGVLDNRNTPLLVGGGYDYVAIDSNVVTVCGLRSGGDYVCWGNSDLFGDGNPGSFDFGPTLISTGLNFTSLSVGCGIADVAYCWGHNLAGEVGDGTNTDRWVPTAVVWAGDPPLTEEVDSDIEVVVAPSLTFAVAGSTSSCNGVSPSSGAISTSTSVSLGRINSTSGAVSQSVTLITNAGGGGIVQLRSTGPFQSASGASLSGVSGTNATPVVFPGAGTEAWGYTTDDASLGGGTANRFVNGGSRWAALTTLNAPALDRSGAGTSTGCIGYQASTSTSTSAGNYSVTVIYTAAAFF